MATWKDENENMDYTLRQILKKIDQFHKPTFSIWNDSSLFDHDVEKEIDEY